MKMANTTLFQSIKNRLIKTDTYNEAGGIAYTLTHKQQLAQLAATGCLNNTYYADAQSRRSRQKILRQPSKKTDADLAFDRHRKTTA